MESDKVVGIKEIAEIAGVSIGTVDRVVHNRYGVAEKTRQKVLAVIEQLGYSPNPLASRLSGFSSWYKIAVILPHAAGDNSFWAQHVSAIEALKGQFKSFGLLVEILPYTEKDEVDYTKAVRRFVEGDFAACIVVPRFKKATKDLLSFSEQHKLPVVFLDTDFEHKSKFSYIGQNAYESGVVAAKIMSWRLHNDESILICHIGRGSTLNENFKRREAGFRHYVDQHSPRTVVKSFQVDVANLADSAKELLAVVGSAPGRLNIFVPNTRSYVLVELIGAETAKKSFLLGYDLVPENVALLQSGLIDVLISQKPEEQCSKALHLLQRKLLNREDPADHPAVPIDIVIKENLEYYQ